MPSLNFKKQFEPHIRSGRKRHSIRDKRKRPWKPGDKLYLFTGMRTKHCRRIANTVCVKVDDILIRIHENADSPLATNRFEVFINGVGLEPDEKESLAYADGFENFEEMMEFWDGRLPFTGDLIHWDWSQLIQSHSRVSRARLGGQARAKKLSKKRQSEIGRAAVNARWKKRKQDAER